MGRAALSLSDNLTAIRYFSQAIESKPYLAAACQKFQDEEWYA
jgi:hypothetical protein